MSPHDRYTRCERLSPRCHLKRPVRPRRHQARPCTRITRRRRPYRHRGECLNNSAGWIGGPEPALNQATMNARSGAHCRESCARCCGVGPVSRSTMRRWRRWHGCARRCEVTWVSNCAGTLQAERWTLCTPEPLRCWIIRWCPIPDRRRPIPCPGSDAYVSLSAGSPRSDRAPIVPAIASVQWPRLGASSRLLRGPAHR